MSLRTRVLLLIGLVLLLGVAIGSAFAGFEAKRALRAELAAGMSGGAQTVRGAFEDLPRSDHAERDLDQLVATFDGNRHVRARLIGPGGRTLAVSREFEPPARVPGWFARSLGPPPASLTLPAPVGAAGQRAIRLEPIASLDIGAYWREFSAVAVALSASAAVGLALVHLAIGAALKPLSELSAAFVRIGSGAYDSQVRVRVHGPRELAVLERGFNHMAVQLAAMNDRNLMLEGQLLTLQEEERADIARDLHDEIGPQLFAVTVDAQMIGQAAANATLEDIPGRVKAIQTAVARMQRLVRDILGRLRPTLATELGLNAALSDLAVFWQARHPDVTFALDLLDDESRLSEQQKDTVYRVVQEGVSNALRHADPTCVGIRVRADSPDQVVAEVVDNGGAGRSRAPGVGLGLIGMRERVRASGGVLTIDRGQAGAGWTILARLPLDTLKTASADRSGPP